MIQALVSALCSMIYIGSAVARGAKNPTTSKDAQAFIGLNISVSLLTVIASFVILCLKERLLKRADKKDEYEGTEKRNSATVEMGRIYMEQSAGAVDTIGFENPIHMKSKGKHPMQTLFDRIHG